MLSRVNACIEVFLPDFADTPKETTEQKAKENVPEKELKENQEIAKKLEEKKDK